METLIAVFLAFLIVAGVFVAAICCALLKKSRNGGKLNRNSTTSSVYANQFTNQLAISNTSITPSARLPQRNGNQIGVFHIHVSTNGQSREQCPGPRHYTLSHNNDKSLPEELPPSYEIAIKMPRASLNLTTEEV